MTRQSKTLILIAAKNAKYLNKVERFLLALYTLKREGRKKYKFSRRGRGIVKGTAGDKFASTTSASREMAVWITRLREYRNLVLVVFSRRCKISGRNTCKGKRTGRAGDWRTEGRAS